MGYAIYDAGGTNKLAGWFTTHSFDRWSSGVCHKLYDINKETIDDGNYRFGYVFLVTHVGLDESKSWDTGTVANGDYTIKVRASDLGGHTSTTSIAVTVDN
jgi:hypothetical protein